jgi:hypothetical protein
MAIMSDQYFCEECQLEFTFTKAMPHHEFPTKPKCPECGSGEHTHRIWHGGKMTFNVRKGKVGNAANSYTNEREAYNNKAQNTLKKLKNTKNPIVGIEG